jgi:hypothetical protein
MEKKVYPHNYKGAGRKPNPNKIIKHRATFYTAENDLLLIAGGNIKCAWRKLKSEHEKAIKRLINGEGDE